MKKFLSAVALFFVPVVLIYGLFNLALYRSGEWHDEQDIARMVLAGEPAFIGYAYRGNNEAYKYMVASGKKAELLVLGTSRSMQLRSEFFSEESFYNAGGGANYVHAYRFFLESLPEDALPKTLVVVLDQYFFQEGWSILELLPELNFSTYPFDYFATMRHMMQNWAIGKFRLKDLITAPPHTYGIAALGRGSGFYPDGSYCYGNLADHPEKGSDVGFHDSFDRIARGVNRFEWADEVYPPSLEEMNRLFSFCKEHDIQVVGIIPPYAPAVCRRMAETGKYTYMEKIAPALCQIMEPLGYELYDFTSMPDAPNEEYVDGYHGGDRVYARLMLKISETSQILNGKIDTEYLQAALAPSSSPLRLAA